MATTTTGLLTAEEFLKLPEEEGVTRELIEGELRERPMTTRSPKHSIAMGRIAQSLNNWLDAHRDFTGAIAVGEVRCRLEKDPDSIVGIDVAYFEGAEAVRQSQQSTFFDMAPVVAVEVLSPSDTHEDVSEKIRRYLAVGTKQVWVADPDFRTVTVYRGDGSAQLYHSEQTFAGEPELSGFRVKTAALFSANTALTR